MRKNNILQALIIVVFSICSCNTKSEIIVLETDYEKYLNWKENYLLIGDGLPSLTLKYGQIKEFPIQISNFIRRKLNAPVVESNNKCYLLDDKLGFDPEKYVHLNLESLTPSGGDKLLHISESRAAYIRNDSVFFSDFDSHVEHFIMKNAFVTSINKNYIFLRRGFFSECFIYNFNDQGIYTLPEEIITPDYVHPYFIINSPLDEGIHVLDLQLNEVISQDEGYTERYILGDWLVLYGKGNLIKVFRKNKAIKFDEKIVSIDYREFQNTCFLTNSDNKILPLNADMTEFGEVTFDRILPVVYGSKYSLLQKGELVQLFDSSFKQIFEGKYENASYIYDDRFIVNKNGIVSVVDANENEVIANVPNKYKKAKALTLYGQRFIKLYSGSANILYDYSGVEVVRWKDEKGDTYVNGKPLEMGINTRMLSSLSNKEEEEINPSGSYCTINNTSIPYHYYACDKSGKRLSKDYLYMIPLEKGGEFLVQSDSLKVSVIKIEK